MAISVKVIDGMHGRAAEGVTVQLGQQTNGRWESVLTKQTDEQGLLGEWWAPHPLSQGVYRIEVDIDAYFAALGITPFFPKVVVVFRVVNPGESFVIPVIITPYVHMTYRHGSSIDW